MAELRATCVTRTGTTHETITHLGGPANGGWKMTKQQVIDSMRTHTFYTEVDGKRADLHVVKGNPDYVQTIADGRWTNNLLALPRCP